MDPREPLARNPESLQVEQALTVGIKKSVDNQIRETDDWFQVITPAAPTIFKNGVYRSVLPDEGADERIRAVIEEYAKAKVPFRWIVSPSSRPLDLADRLIRFGFTRGDEMIGMVASPDDFASVTGSSEIIQVTQVDPASAEAWLGVQFKGWGLPDQAIPNRRRDILMRLEDSSGNHPDFIAWIDGNPVGTAGLRVYGDFALLVSAVVLPEYRGRGIYRALLATRMKWLQEKGIRTAVVHAVSDTSAPICRRMGFREVARMQNYCYGGLR